MKYIGLLDTVKLNFKNIFLIVFKYFTSQKLNSEYL